MPNEQRQRELRSHIARVRRLPLGSDCGLPGTDQHSLHPRDFIGLDEAKLILPGPWIDNPTFHDPPFSCTTGRY